MADLSAPTDSPRPTEHLRDLTDAELRASHRLKWAVAPEGTLPAWVAEMDLALAEPIAAAAHRGIGLGAVGYPGPGVDVAGALAGFSERRYGWAPDPARVTVTASVLGALDLVLAQVAEPAPVILPVPAYTPFLSAPGTAGRETLLVETDPWGPAGAQMPLEGIADAIGRGGRTLILCNPHNPLGRVWTRAELEAVRDLAEAAEVLVIADEIHAPLTRPGVTTVPYLSVASPDAPAVSLVSSTKPFNCPGLPCAQIVWNRAEDQARVDTGQPFAVPPATTLGSMAAAAAYTECDGWLDELRERVQANHALLVTGLAESLPQARVLPHEGTYLAWVSFRAYGYEDPAAVAREKAGVMLGDWYGPGSEGCARVNLATSPERVAELARRLGALGSLATP